MKPIVGAFIMHMAMRYPMRGFPLTLSAIVHSIPLVPFPEPFQIRTLANNQSHVTY